MNIYSAKTWKEWILLTKRFFPRPGIFSDLHYTNDGIVIGASAEIFWRHPWTVSMRWEFDETNDELGKWVAYVWPGFVNGRDVVIRRNTKEGHDQIPLTDEDPAGLTMRWRNPLASSSISATLEGELVYGAGEGFPPYFVPLGVKPAAKGGKNSDAAPNDPERTRELRACDIFLSVPRPTADSSVSILNPASDGQILRIDTVFHSAGVNPNIPQFGLHSTPKWSPPVFPTLEERFFGTAVEPNTDEILIATVWMVSPPDYSSESVPDQSWQPYVQQRVFWNLMHASRQEPPQVPDSAIEFQAPPLLFGIGDAIFKSFLTPINDKYAMMAAYFGAADYQGDFWTV